MADEFKQPLPVFYPKNSGNYWVSTIVSTGASGLTSGSTIDVRGLTNLTAFIQRTVSTTAIELEVSPDATNWFSWSVSSSLTTLPAAGEFTSQDKFLSGATIGFVRGLPNVSATFTSACVVTLNGFTK